MHATVPKSLDTEPRPFFVAVPKPSPTLFKSAIYLYPCICIFHKCLTFLCTVRVGLATLVFQEIICFYIYRKALMGYFIYIFPKLGKKNLHGSPFVLS